MDRYLSFQETTEEENGTHHDQEPEDNDSTSSQSSFPGFYTPRPDELPHEDRNSIPPEPRRNIFD